MKRPIRWVGRALTVLLCIELSCAVSLFVLSRVKGLIYRPLKLSLSEDQKNDIRKLLADSPHRDSYSAPLGWTLPPNRPDTNAHGMRADQEYPRRPPEHRIRLAAFGDSFVMGAEVDHEDTWEAQLDSMNPHVEVLNFGVRAYGLDQSLLRYLSHGTPFHPDIVLIGFFQGSMRRNVTVFLPFMNPGGMPLTKPRFILEDDHLVFVENPFSRREDYARLLENEQATLSQLGEHDYDFQTGYWEGPFDLLSSIRFWKVARSTLWEKYLETANNVDRGYDNIKSEAFQVTARLFDAFWQAAVEHRSLPIIIVFPARQDLVQYRRSQIRDYAPLKDYLEMKGVRYVDLLDGFDAYGRSLPVEDLFMANGHYSPRGNEIVAKDILRYLEEHGLTSREALVRALKKDEAYATRQLIHAP